VTWNAALTVISIPLPAKLKAEIATLG
jgi:hypothetical protein